MNLEIATKRCWALKNRPPFICIVPEKQEITTEGGLNLNIIKISLKK